MAKPVKKKVGLLAQARASVTKALKTDDWHVTLDPEELLEPFPNLPTGSIVIDYLIGGKPNRHGVSPCPGLPKGRMSQVWGHESAGKTTLALTAAATTCQNGGTVLYVDWENDIVPDYAASLGVPITDPDKFELAQPDTLEQGIQIALTYAEYGVDLIVFDSIGSAALQRLVNRSLEDVGGQSKVGELQQIWSQELTTLKATIKSTGTHIMGISQVRAKISTMRTNGPTTQPQGGNAWKFFSSIRMELRRVSNESSKQHNALTHKTEDRVTGGIIKAKMVKCKMSDSQGREEIFYIRWGEGIDDYRSIMEIAIGHGIIKKGGAWLTWNPPQGEEVKEQGKERLRKFLKKNPEKFQMLYKQVIPFLTPKVEEDHEGEDEWEEPEELVEDDVIDDLISEAASGNEGTAE